MMKTYRKIEIETVRATAMSGFDFLLKNPSGRINDNRGPEYRASDIGRASNYSAGYELTDRAGRRTWIPKEQFDAEYREVDDEQS